MQTAMPTKDQILKLIEEGKRPMGYETNFVVKKFLALPVEKKREVWEQIHSDDHEQWRAGAGTLIHLLLDDLEGMTGFLNEIAGKDFFAKWLVLPEQVSSKTGYLFFYFLTYLEEAEGEFRIKSIELIR